MNNITIELCTEDRARLDRIAELLEKQTATKSVCTCKADVLPGQMTIDTAPVEAPTESTEKPTDAQDEATPTDIPPADETPTEAKEPSVSLEQIQQKVMQLAAANGGVKKAKVRDIINTYGTKVSDLKEQPDKWDEVWQKLTALESEA